MTRCPTTELCTCVGDGEVWDGKRMKGRVTVSVNGSIISTMCIIP